MIEGSFFESEKREGTFVLNKADLRNKLYFPLFNDAGMMSAITPEFKGDLKVSQNHFHLHPMVTEDLINAKYSRNFWIIPENGKPWSVTGVSAANSLHKMNGNAESVSLLVKPGFFEVKRKNELVQLEATCQAFVPANDDLVEILVFTVTNCGDESVSFCGVPAIPVYARSADNQRDHRQVTTLLSRVFDHEAGIFVKPTMSFDERGHTENDMRYVVLSFDDFGQTTSKKYQRLQDFVGLSGNLEAPEAIYKAFDPPQKVLTEGREVLAAFGFSKETLSPGQSKSYIVVNGITASPADMDRWAKTYNTLEKVRVHQAKTEAFWQERVKRVSLETGNLDLDNWFTWVTFQPMARKIFGCSFLPDFGYGRGGRGWRDLWQDCLALILTNPKETTELLWNNFAGIRCDGSNATIIGSKPGEFIADRNNIPRTWMDHGAWPLLTLDLYLQQSGDLEFLLRKQTYFKDQQSHRCRKKDLTWNGDANDVLTEKGSVYQGTILEHLLLQNVTQFYNVGEHNICRLEGADWNDGLDMARKRGESVAFHCMFAHNLGILAGYVDQLAKKGHKTVMVLKEIKTLFDTLTQSPIAYDSVSEKVAQLDRFMATVAGCVSGNVIPIDSEKLAQDLRKKAEAMSWEVRQHEWLSLKQDQHFFNGYYDDEGKAVEGQHSDIVRMTLTGQVFPIMSGIATDDQIDHVYQAAQTYLKDPASGGYRLNTNFGCDTYLTLGRAFSFSYGDKENGACFSHMVVMFMNALYKRGHVLQGHEVFESLYKMCTTYEKSKILPSIPEYFDAEGRGAYLYLTGSASWMVLTMLTQIFGVRGYLGNLLLEPKLVRSQFVTTKASICSVFSGVPVKITYHNPEFLDYGQYKIGSVQLGQDVLKPLQILGAGWVMPKSLFEGSQKEETLHFVVELVNKES